MKKLLIIILLLLPSILLAQSQGPKTPGTWSQLQDFAGDVTWNLPSFPSSVVLNNNHSYFLIGTNMGFTLPAGATPTGEYHVRWTKAADTSNAIVDTNIQLYNNAVVGSNHSNSDIWLTSATQQTYGCCGDVWGTSWGVSLTVAQINASTFGSVMRCDNVLLSNVTGTISAMDVQVFYSLPSKIRHRVISALLFRRPKREVFSQTRQARSFVLVSNPKMPSSGIGF